MRKTVSLSFFWQTLFLGFALLLNVTLGYRLFFSDQSFFAWQGVQQHFADMQKDLADIQQRLNYVRENEILYVFEKKQLVNSIWTETEEDLHNE